MKLVIGEDFAFQKWLDLKLKQLTISVHGLISWGYYWNFTVFALGAPPVFVHSIGSIKFIKCLCGWTTGLHDHHGAKAAKIVIDCKNSRFFVILSLKFRCMMPECV